MPLRPHPATVASPFRRDLTARREVTVNLPEFLICALEARVAEANGEGEPCTLNDYIESELVNLITLRDVAELNGYIPGFASAVQRWVEALRE